MVGRACGCQLDLELIETTITTLLDRIQVVNVTQLTTPVLVCNVCIHKHMYGMLTCLDSLGSVTNHNNASSIRGQYTQYM